MRGKRWLEDAGEGERDVIANPLFFSKDEERL